MKFQTIEDSKGQKAGVFIPIEDWTHIINQYPDILDSQIELSAWEKELIDERLEAINKNPEKLLGGAELFEELRRAL